jgi:membrane protease YdiL (CAAX protease family)
MSILSLASDVSESRNELIQGIEFGVFAVFSVSIALVSRVLPFRTPRRPDRIDPRRPAWLLAAVMGAAVLVYMFSARLYIDFKYPQTSQQSATTEPDLTPQDNAVLSILPGLLGLAVLVAGDKSVRDFVGQNLGYGPRYVGAGLRRGILGAVIVIPFLYFGEYAVEMIYRAVHYQHELEHPLLKSLTEQPSRGVKIGIVIGACVVAPLFEEMLFRGHLQTLIRRMLYRLSTPFEPQVTQTPDLPPFLPLLKPTDLPLPPGLAPEAAAMPKPPPAPSAWHTWGAILITSLLFAMVHPLWSAPIIFVLAVGLGYAYELTGNLWVSITIHAAFNSLSTAIFLWSSG